MGNMFSGVNPNDVFNRIMGGKKNGTKKEETQANYHTQKVIGFDIEFPFAPYGIQKAMMSKLSSSLANKEHFLLESPTGTGKTLVLLSTTLAWQRKSKEINQPLMSEKLRKKYVMEKIEKIKNKPCKCGRRPNAPRSELDQLKDEKDDLKKGAKCGYDPIDEEKSRAKEEDCSGSSKRVKLEDNETSPYFSKPKQQDPDIIIIDSDDEEEQKTYKRNKQPDTSSNNNETSNKQDDICEIVEIPPIRTSNDSDFKILGEMCDNCKHLEAEELMLEIQPDPIKDKQGYISSKISKKVPRIYYGTRTHKQITQVVRELNKTPYKKNLRMCILSARERACIHPEVRDQPDRNDRCQELIKKSDSNKNNEKCPYYLDNMTVTSTFEGINEEFNSEAWDIEDAAQFGRENQCCPYYGIRGLQENADITFCPYNYLLDPNIRKALQINLKNAVIIFDEAHNIEDICRDSASILIDTNQIAELLRTIEIAGQTHMQGSTIKDAYDFFRLKFTFLTGRLRNFEFDQNSKSDDGEFISKKVMVGNQMIDFLDTVELGPSSLENFKSQVKVLRGDDEDSDGKSSKNSESVESGLSFNQMQIIEQLLICMNFMYANNSKSLSNYRLVITKQLERTPFKKGAHNNETSSNYVWKLHLLCMDPGTTFDKIHGEAWSVIVASGTLSPTESLKSELGCLFPNVFEGAHVIEKERIFASILSAGPRGNLELKCTYQECMKLDFQDEVGAIVQHICDTVPNGVLCFFPSYERLETFHKRWTTTRIMNKIKQKKMFFQEQRNLSAAKFEQELVKFNEFANNDGAVLFAVFRGKVSEGIDFADKAARAVITIGIPYPNFKELAVGLKKEYNDMSRPVRPNLMSGGDWYSAQAFRALNQALGRCIRHKDDWGAIIMIDSRLKYPSNLKNVSKWLRQVIRTDTNYSLVKEDLERYLDRRRDEERE